jgi:hypothetical protein
LEGIKAKMNKNEKCEDEPNPMIGEYLIFVGQLARLCEFYFEKHSVKIHLLSILLVPLNTLNKMPDL